MITTLAPELLTRLERLATVRRIGTDDLLSEAIRAYLDREEAQETVIVLPVPPPVVRIHSPRLADPQDAARLRKIVVEE